MKAQNLLIRMLKKELKSVGFSVNKFTAEDWETIAYEWVKESQTFVKETIADDVIDNEKLFRLAKRRKALPTCDPYLYLSK
jgi:O-acetylhomoserine/O-acetylserine sulfhydrylase-like pyridoxal-dependent enzyme